MCCRGDIYYADLGAPTGSCQCGLRPVLVVSNDTVNVHAPVITVVPIIQVQLIIGGNIPQLLNIEYCQARAAGDQNRLRRFAGGHPIFGILPDGKVIRILFCELFKILINRVFVIRIILPHIHLV